MTGAGGLPDGAERRRIEEDLSANLLVEAGAGSGKTTSLTRRMVALIASGEARPREVAAITFTRKAAAELREGFEDALERRLAEARESGASDRARRLNAALREIDRCFVGTIHAFCARLLRERPVEAGLDPAFEELQEAEERAFRRAFWSRHLEALAREEDPLLARLNEVGLEPEALHDCFVRLCGEPDAELPAERIEAPEHGELARELSALLDRALPLLPRLEPENGWCTLQSALRRLEFSRELGWERRTVFFRALERIVGRSLGATYNRWSEDGSLTPKVKEVEEELANFARGGGPAARALDRWYAHRYPDVVAFASRAADAFSRERRRTARLNFQDLLVLAAELLRENPAARQDLGRRFRHLLIDEFQDTDPLQAEVAFLLAARDPTTTDWMEAVPRPGALFVVGDPKQSIYRFRRAEIAVYQQVRARFEALGREHGSELADVVELTANFRSLPAIEEFANPFFRRALPESASTEQAAYAPLRVQPPEGAPEGGVFWYAVNPEDGKNKEAVAREEAPRLAAWIADRVRDGDREPGDFLVLTYLKKYLHLYARALEDRNVPVQVTGSEFMVEDELRALVTLLRALGDPEDPTLVVAVLEGLFFGLDHEQLASYALDSAQDDAPDDHRFRITRPIEDADSASASPVEEALGRLHRWWEATRRHPADVVLGRIVEELGLIPYAAAGELGGTRAGALAYALESVRQAGVDRDASLHVAVEALESALESERAEAPLEPGRTDVVRVMNLHKAKGTEAPVVVLAHPTGKARRRRVGFHSERREDGTTHAYMEVVSRRRRRRTLARPPDWEDLAAREAGFREAEETRLLYVAATRAEEELVVGRCSATEKKSYWAPFYESLEASGEELELDDAPPPDPRELEASAEEIGERVEAADRAREAHDRSTYRAESVTGRVEDADFEETLKGSGGRGRAWGTAVHRALEAAIGGSSGDGPIVQAANGDLRSRCRAIALEAELETDAAGEPVDLAELVETVERVRDSDLLRRALAAEVVLCEVPFAHARPESDSGPVEVIEGTIDLAFREPEGWVLVDYKTDEIDDPEVKETRKRSYRRQVGLYGECWEALTGEPVSGRFLLFTATGEEITC